MIVSLLSQLLDDISKNSRKKRRKCIEEGKIYYGFVRIVGLLLLSLISVEMIVFILFGQETEETKTLIVTLLFTIPIFCIYFYLYIKHYERIIIEYKKTMIL